MKYPFDRLRDMSSTLVQCVCMRIALLAMTSKMWPPLQTDAAAATGNAVCVSATVMHATAYQLCLSAGDVAKPCRPHTMAWCGLPTE